MRSGICVWMNESINHIAALQGNYATVQERARAAAGLIRPSQNVQTSANGDSTLQFFGVISALLNLLNGM